LQKLLSTDARGGVTRDDVEWCYRNLLGRPPESDDVVRFHMTTQDFRGLVRAFAASAEFSHRIPPQALRPMPLPTQRIDVQVDARQLAAAIAKVKAAWTHMGQERPHHSVLTNDAFLPHNLPQTIDQFWASGEAEVAQVLAIMKAHGQSAAGKACVEYGCGVGRITGVLARQFEHYHAYDISAAHLAEARKRIDSLGLANVSLVQCADTFLADLEPCDLFYSRIVFQHNPPPLMDALVRSSLKALKPGGLAIFQLPTYAVGYSFDFERWLKAGHTLDMEMHCLPQRYVFQAIADAGCVPLEIYEDGSVGDPNFISNTFVVRRPSLQA
jgi:SAM-dependent methyltransferase